MNVKKLRQFERDGREKQISEEHDESVEISLKLGTLTPWQMNKP